MRNIIISELEEYKEDAPEIKSQVYYDTEKRIRGFADHKRRVMGKAIPAASTKRKGIQ